MRTFFLAVLFVCLLAVLAQPAMAQEQPGIPPTAQEGLGWLQALMLGGIGIIVSYVMDGIKRLPYLTDSEKTEFGGAAAQLITVAVAIVAAVVVRAADPYAAWLDTSGLWGLVQYFGPILVGAELRYRLKKVEFKALPA